MLGERRERGAVRPARRAPVAPVAPIAPVAPVAGQALQWLLGARPQADGLGPRGNALPFARPVVTRGSDAGTMAPRTERLGPGLQGCSVRAARPPPTLTWPWASCHAPAVYLVPTCCLRAMHLPLTWRPPAASIPTLVLRMQSHADLGLGALVRGVCTLRLSAPLAPHVPHLQGGEAET